MGAAVVDGVCMAVCFGLFGSMRNTSANRNDRRFEAYTRQPGLARAKALARARVVVNPRRKPTASSHTHAYPHPALSLCSLTMCPVGPVAALGMDPGFHRGSTLAAAAHAACQGTRANGHPPLRRRPTAATKQSKCC